MSRPFFTKLVTTPPNRYAVAVHPSAEVSFTVGRAAHQFRWINGSVLETTTTDNNSYQVGSGIPSLHGIK
jgi:hypothetical protein